MYQSLRVANSGYPPLDVIEIVQEGLGRISGLVPVRMLSFP